jgi:DNA-binding GntR family transcriptional regulator
VESDKGVQPLPRTVTAAVADRLRIMILHGELKAGERVKVQRLEPILNVSQSPIREALRQLEAEGLVYSEPQRGVTVMPMSAKDLHDLYEFRRLIEPELAVRSAARRTDDYQVRMTAALGRLVGTVEDPGSDRYLREHSIFHWTLLEPAGSSVSKRVLDQLWQMSERYIRLTVASPEHRRADAREHHLLCEAMESGTKKIVRELMVRHLSAAEVLVTHSGQPVKDEIQT